jgi:hypothetical protein
MEGGREEKKGDVYPLNRKARVGEYTVIICDFVSFLAGASRFQICVETGDDIAARHGRFAQVVRFESK